MIISGSTHGLSDTEDFIESLDRSLSSLPAGWRDLFDSRRELIAREAGVIVTGVRGERLDAPLAVEANVAWAGYANENIRMQIEPLLQAALVRRSLL